MTVQTRSCRVSHHYTCAADPEGYRWRIDYGVNGAYFRGLIDHETQWVESHSSDGTIRRLQPNNPDPASFSELLDAGKDTFEFSTLDNNGVQRNVRGYDRLTGETAVIDGITLSRTQYDVRATNPVSGQIWHSRGFQYVHPEWRLFLSGTGESDLGEGFLPRNFTPIDFIFPGEPGYLSTQPLYDCDALTVKGPKLPEGAAPASLTLGGLK